MIKKRLNKPIIIISLIVIISSIICYSIFFQQIINSPPIKPETPVGENTIDVFKSASYETSSSDPDNDSIKYGWDWNGDAIVDVWTEWYTPNQTLEKIIHKWETAGTFNVKVKTQDIHGAESEWSNPLEVTVNFVPSYPNTPTLTGPTNLTVDEVGMYYAVASTPDNLPIRYYFMWDDRTYNITDFVKSEQMVNLSHAWDTPGNFTVVCEVENQYYYRSHEAILNVTISEKK